MSSASNQMISIQPEELKFVFELDKQSFCDLKVANKTENHIAFKVKTTSPKKYFVRPNTGVIQPWDSCVIRVTLQAQREAPPDMQCKDKFLLQSTSVPSNTDVDELPADTFTKDSGKVIEESKLRVLYVPPSAQSNSEDDASGSSVCSPNPHSSLQRLKEERDSAVRQRQQLQQELEMLQRRKRKNGAGFSIMFAGLVGVIGIIVGLLMKLSLSSPPAPAE